MKQETLEKISALVDDEVSTKEVSQVLGHLEGSEGLQRVWGRYQLIGDAVRGERVDRRLLDVADRVRERLRDEPTVLAPRPEKAAGGASVWVKPLAGTAVAASVAVAVVLLAPEAINREAPPAARVAEASAGDRSLVEARSYVPQSGIRWDLGKPDVESKLNSYLVNHNKYAPSANMHGMLPYASFVGYDVGR